MSSLVLIFLAILGACALAVAAGGTRWSLSPRGLLKQCTRVFVTPVLAWVYRADAEDVERRTRAYWVGRDAAPAGPASESWKRVRLQHPGLTVHGSDPLPWPRQSIPFVYEVPDRDFLRGLRARYRLDEIVGAALEEYPAMLRLGAWLGTRWDHGVDKVPGSHLLCDPIAVIAAGEQGSKYWCEIAAKTTVQAASALGWHARLVTASRDGYTWEHAVAELWSNQFAKWFVMDTDFNVVFENEGVPLSAFELAHQGERLRDEGKLTVRPIASAKPSLPLIDLMPFYRYVHVDLRNDWCSRRLRRGSPMGGDRATWWTKRSTMRPVLTAKIRVDSAERFDWKVNAVAIHTIAAQRRPEGLLLEIALETYSPQFTCFEVGVDSAAYQRIAGARYSIAISAGEHTIRARVVTSGGYPGPVSLLRLRLHE